MSSRTHKHTPLSRVNLCHTPRGHFSVLTKKWRMYAVDEDDNIIIAVLCCNGCKLLPPGIMQEHILDGSEV